MCALFSRSVVLPVSRNRIFPSFHLRVQLWQQRCLTEKTTWEIPEHGRMPFDFFPTRESTRSFLGSSVLIGLEPSPNLSYTNVQVGQRDCPSSHRIRLPQLYRAQKRRRKTRNMRCEHTQGCAVETDLSSLGANLMRGAGGSGARLENGGGPGGTSPCSDAPLLLLPAPHPVTWWGNHSCPLLEPTDNLNAATSCSSCHSKPGELAL